MKKLLTLALTVISLSAVAIPTETLYSVSVYGTDDNDTKIAITKDCKDLQDCKEKVAAYLCVVKEDSNPNLAATAFEKSTGNRIYSYGFISWTDPKTKELTTLCK